MCAESKVACTYSVVTGSHAMPSCESRYGQCKCHGLPAWLCSDCTLCLDYKQRGLDMQAVMAIGDGGNDLPLLQSVGLGIAMGNAVPQVCLHGKQAALHVKCDGESHTGCDSQFVNALQLLFDSTVQLLGLHCYNMTCRLRGTSAMLPYMQVLAAANATVANNNEDGIAEAIERFIL